MKVRNLLFVATAALLLSVGGCSKSEDNRNVAVENLKKEVAGLDVWMNEKGQALLSDPKSAMAGMSELVAKLKAIKSEDLPADLKSAWGDFIAKFDEMSVVMAEVASDPVKALRQNTLGRIMIISNEMKPIANRLTETGKKYGIDKFAQLAPK